jgi:4-amino-4-deoxy-L-arabinose transferase-like glycosyltransferase
VRKYWIYLIVVFSLYLTWTFDHSLWNPDETRDAGIAAEMFRNGDYVVPTLNGEPFLEKPPLYYWTSAVIYTLTGRVSAGTTRLPAALYGIMGILFTFFIGRRLFNERVGLFAASLLATSLQYFRMSHFAMMDVPLAALVAGALFFYLKGSRVGFAIFATLAFFAKGFLGVLLPGVVVSLDLFCQKKWKEWITILGVGIIIFGALAGPWFWGLWERGGVDYLRVFLIDNHWTRFLSKSSDHSEHFWFYYFVSFPIDFLPWSPFLVGPVRDLIRRPQKYLESASLRFLLLWFCGLLLFFTVSSSKRSIYLLPLFPAASLLCAAWFDEAIRGKAKEAQWEKRTMIVFGSVAALIGFSSFFLAPQFDQDKSFVPVCEAVKINKQEGAVIGYNLSEMEQGVFGFYLNRRLINPRNSAQFTGTINEMATNSFCLIVNRNKMDEIKEILPRQARLVYEHRPNKKTRSYRVYVNP